MTRITYKAMKEALDASGIPKSELTYWKIEDIYCALREKAGNPAEVPFSAYNLAGGYPPWTKTVERFEERYYEELDLLDQARIDDAK
tara:strand:- start:57 stop:317 length:261 start_codon:yes stop_codon:yes gene_type:complete